MDLARRHGGYIRVYFIVLWGQREPFGPLNRFRSVLGVGSPPDNLSGWANVTYEALRGIQYAINQSKSQSICAFVCPESVMNLTSNTNEQVFGVPYGGNAHRRGRVEASESD